jgi:hypothetical protein
MPNAALEQRWVILSGTFDQSTIALLGHQRGTHAQDLLGDNVPSCSACWSAAAAGTVSLARTKTAKRVFPCDLNGASPLVVLLLVVGLCTLVVNIGLAGQTKGYAEGRLTALGQRVVGVTAWIGLALMGLVVVTRVNALAITRSVLLLLGV